jgi:hypothetical protein
MLRNSALSVTKPDRRKDRVRLRFSLPITIVSLADAAGRLANVMASHCGRRYAMEVLIMTNNLVTGHDKNLQQLESPTGGTLCRRRDRFSVHFNKSKESLVYGPANGSVALRSPYSCRLCNPRPVQSGCQFVKCWCWSLPSELLYIGEQGYIRPQGCQFSK